MLQVKILLLMEAGYLKDYEFKSKLGFMQGRLVNSEKKMLFNISQIKIGKRKL